MIIDHNSRIQGDLIIRLYDTIAVAKVSSVEMMSEIIGIDEELVQEGIEELVKEGSLNGAFSDDKKRFFLSNVKTSSAPTSDNVDTGLEIKKPNTLPAIMVVITGVIMLAVGQFMRSLVYIHPGMENGGVAVFMFGFAIMLAGWYQYSRLNPPSKV